MAELTAEELRDVFEVMVKPIGHPDPVGFMARALLTSDGDPDFIDINGKQGFIPLHPDRVVSELGATDVQSLEGNVMTALALDIKYFEQFKDINKMITGTHQDFETAESPTAETRVILDELADARTETNEFMFPRLATVEDVINALRASVSDKPSKNRLNFFKEILNGRS